MSMVAEMTPEVAARILDRMGSTGQPPERGAQFVNVATTEILEVLRDEYLRPMKASDRNSAFKLVQAPFGGGKTHFLHCLREISWAEGFATSLVGLSPKECPFDQPDKIYRALASNIELPVEGLEPESSLGLEKVLRQIAEEQIEKNGREVFLEWLRTDFSKANIEDRSFSRGVRHFLEAVAKDDLDAEEVLSDFLLGISVAKQDLVPYRLREVLNRENAFRWLRSLVQSLAALSLPGVVLMFDEMDRNMSLSVRRRREIGDNLRQMIDYCGQSLLPNVLMCYAVPPEFMDTIVPEYPALAQRLKGASQFSGTSPMQPIIDLDKLPMAPTELMGAIGKRLLELAGVAHGHRFDLSIQKANLMELARELGERSFESGTRRTFVKAVVTMIEAQRRGDESILSAEEIRSLAGLGGAEAAAAMPGEMDF